MARPNRFRLSFPVAGIHVVGADAEAIEGEARGRPVLTLRLNRFIDDDIVTRSTHAQSLERFDYLLTDKGWQLRDILLAVSAWGDRWTTMEAGPPALLHHRTCGHPSTTEIRCSKCGEPLHAADTEVTPLR